MTPEHGTTPNRGEPCEQPEATANDCPTPAGPEHLAHAMVAALRTWYADADDVEVGQIGKTGASFALIRVHIGTRAYNVEIRQDPYSR